MNKVLLLNTSVERTVTLPAGSSVKLGDWIRIVDVGSDTGNTTHGFKGNAYIKNITIKPLDPDKIQGGNPEEALIIDVDSQAITLMWCGSTFDWRIIN